MKDYPLVLAAIRGADAVISVVGHIRRSDPYMQTEGMRNIVRAMEKSGVTRVLSLTGTGARVPGDRPSLFDSLLNPIVWLIDPARMRDGIAHVDVLRASTCDWTVLRMLKLTNGTTTRPDYRLTLGGPAELLTERKKVARILLDLVSDTKYVRALPVVSG